MLGLEVEGLGILRVLGFGVHGTAQGLGTIGYSQIP